MVEKRRKWPGVPELTVAAYNYLTGLGLVREDYDEVLRVAREDFAGGLAWMSRSDVMRAYNKVLKAKAKKERRRRVE